MNKHLLIIATALLVVASIPACAKIVLVNNGVSRYRIVVAVKALPVVSAAAMDLQEYVKKATGAELPIVRLDIWDGKPSIVVGGGPVTKRLGVSLANIKAEGFRIKTVGANLVIAGKDTDGDAGSDHWRFAPQAGTRNGVDQFLENVMGIRWFFPGETGEYVPARKSVAIPVIDIKGEPGMIYRRLSYVYGNNTPPQRGVEVKKWLRRNRNGWSIVWAASHTWIENFTAETYFKSHPDWFALVNVQRLASAPLGIQMCTTNPGALDEFARVAVNIGKENPGVMFTLTPNDGSNFCECDKCKALDRKKDKNGAPVLTDRILTYANEVAKRVNQVLPKQTFGLLAYSYYAEPPVYAKVNPSVYIMEVCNDTNVLYKSGSYAAYHLGRLMGWKKSVDRLFFYAHPEGFGGMDMPVMHTDVVKKLYKNLGDAGVTGYSMNNITSFAASGLNNYLYLKMAWNPKADIDAIYTDALNGCYGEKAAPLVRSYFDDVQKRWGLFSKEAISMQEKNQSVAAFPAALELVYPGLYEKWAVLLKAQVEAASDKGQQARLKMLMDNLEYTRMTVDLYNLSKQVIGKGSPSREKIVEARDLAKRRAEYVLNNQNTNLFATASDGVLYVEQAFSLPFNTQVYDALLSEISGGKPKAEAASIAAPPVIDGDISEAAWQGLPEMLIDSHKDDGSKSGIKTTAKIARDSTNIYLAIRCDEPLMADIKDSVVARGGPVWDENEVEIFLDPLCTRKAFRQILVNSLGTVAEFKDDGNGSAAWESNARAAVKKGVDSWTVEIAVPVSSVTDKPVRSGDIWGLNICRFRPVAKPAEYTCWSPTFGGFGRPNRFGFLILR